MDNYNFTSFQAFVDLLRQLCEEKRSGTLFAATDANRMARIDLSAGQINAINFMHKKGSAALSLLPLIQVGRARFSDGVHSDPPGPASDLPATEDILSHLLKAQAPPTSERRAQSPSFTLDSQMREVLETLMADYIGPVASVICEEHFESADSMQALLSALASEIGDSEQATRFMADARARLQKG